MIKCFGNKRSGKLFMLRRATDKNENCNYDFVVVGGGMTGVCTALAAARNGASVALVHDRPVLGGNASSEVKLHICGASASMTKPELSEGGILHELMLRNKRINDSHVFSIWDAVLFNAVKQEKNLTLYLNTSMLAVYIDADRVQQIECYQLTTEKNILLSATFFADCTGNGTLCAYAGAKYRTGTEAQAEFGEPHAPKVANNKRMGNTILFKAVDRGRPVEFVPPVEIIHFTEEQLRYRTHCAKISDEMQKSVDKETINSMCDGFCPDYGFWWMEIPGEKEDIIEEYEDIRDELVKAVYGVWDHIKNGGEHGAENYELVWVGMLPGTRESRRIEGDYILNENDILENRRFSDKVAYGGWNVDDNSIGLFDFDHVPAKTIPFPGSYDIPYRSYCVKEFKNLFVGGRCMSATKYGMASTRVMGTCAVGGQAIGTAAALLTVGGSRNVREINIHELQQTLLKDDCYLPELVNLDEKDWARTAMVTVSSEMEGFPAESIINGITRTLGDSPNQWRSKEEDKQPWICLDLGREVKVGSIQLTFDSNFNVEKKITMSSRRQKQQEPGVPKELVRDYDLVLLHRGKVVEVRHMRGNYLRMVRVGFDSVLCDEVKIQVLSTNGDVTARVFEVRVYE